MAALPDRDFRPRPEHVPPLREEPLRVELGRDARNFLMAYGNLQDARLKNPSYPSLVCEVAARRLVTINSDGNMQEQERPEEAADRLLYSARAFAISAETFNNFTRHPELQRDEIASRRTLQDYDRARRDLARQFGISQETLERLNQEYPQQLEALGMRLQSMVMPLYKKGYLHPDRIFALSFSTPVSDSQARTAATTIEIPAMQESDELAAAPQTIVLGPMTDVVPVTSGDASIHNGYNDPEFLDGLFGSDEIVSPKRLEEAILSVEGDYQPWLLASLEPREREDVLGMIDSRIIQDDRIALQQILPLIPPISSLTMTEPISKERQEWVREGCTRALAFLASNERVSPELFYQFVNNVDRRVLASPQRAIRKEVERRLLKARTTFWSSQYKSLLSPDNATFRDEYREAVRNYAEWFHAGNVVRQFILPDGQHTYDQEFLITPQSMEQQGQEWFERVSVVRNVPLSSEARQLVNAVSIAVGEGKYIHLEDAISDMDILRIQFEVSPNKKLHVLEKFSYEQLLELGITPDILGKLYPVTEDISRIESIPELEAAFAQRASMSIRRDVVSELQRAMREGLINGSLGNDFESRLLMKYENLSNIQKIQLVGLLHSFKNVFYRVGFYGEDLSHVVSQAQDRAGLRNIIHSIAVRNEGDRVDRRQWNTFFNGIDRYIRQHIPRDRDDANTYIHQMMQTFEMNIRQTFPPRYLYLIQQYIQHSIRLNSRQPVRAHQLQVGQPFATDSGKDWFL